MCGGKQLRRLYNRVNVRVGTRKPEFPDMRHTSSSKAARIDVIAEPAMLQADASAQRMKEARLKFPNARMVPTGKMREAIGEVFTGMQRGVPQVQVDPPERKAVKGGAFDGGIQVTQEITQGQVPTKLEARDREFRVVRSGDGAVGIEKA